MHFQLILTLSYHLLFNSCLFFSSCSAHIITDSDFVLQHIMPLVESHLCMEPINRTSDLGMSESDVDVVANSSQFDASLIDVPLSPPSSPSSSPSSALRTALGSIGWYQAVEQLLTQTAPLVLAPELGSQNDKQAKLKFPKLTQHALALRRGANASANSLLGRRRSVLTGSGHATNACSSSSSSSSPSAQAGEAHALQRSKGSGQDGGVEDLVETFTTVIRGLMNWHAVRRSVGQVRYSLLSLHCFTCFIALSHLSHRIVDICPAFIISTRLILYYALSHTFSDSFAFPYPPLLSSPLLPPPLLSSPLLSSPLLSSPLLLSSPVEMDPPRHCDIPPHHFRILPQQRLRH